jgi:hypothetical protein
MLDYASDGWHLGGTALGFVLENRALQRFVLLSAGIVVVAAAAVPAGRALASPQWSC